MTSPRQPTTAFWITVALVVVLSYALSIGPAYWITLTYFSESRGAWDIYDVVYWPVNRAYYNRHTQPVILWYLDLWH